MSRRTGPTQAVVDAVKARAQHRCERCGHCGAQVHHRQPRGMGGSREPWINQPANLVLLCQPCHAEVESRREDARRDGFLVPRPRVPADLPVLLWTGDYVFLDDSGAYEPLERTSA